MKQGFNFILCILLSVFLMGCSQITTEDISSADVENNDILDINDTSFEEETEGESETATDAVNAEFPMLSEKTYIDFDSLYNFRSFYEFNDDVYDREYRQYADKRYSENAEKEINKVDDISSFVDKVITFDEYEDINSVKSIAGNLFAISFPIKEEGVEHRTGVFVYNYETEEILLEVLPEDTYTITNEEITENYLYWCEETAFGFASEYAWIIKGMRLSDQSVFTICKEGDLKEDGAIVSPNIGSHYGDNLLFYWGHSQDVIKEDSNSDVSGIEIESRSGTAYIFELMLYNPEENSLLKETEFNIIYNPYAQPCISENDIYTVDYDGSNWYILKYNLINKSFCRFWVPSSEYRTEYIQYVMASEDFIVYETNYGQCYSINQQTLEINKITDNNSWSGVLENYFIYMHGNKLYCQNLSSNQCYQLLEGDSYYINCYDDLCAVTARDEDKIYLFYNTGK